jgi:serine protease Do
MKYKIFRASLTAFAVVALLPLTACSQSHRGDIPEGLEEPSARDVDEAVTASRTNAIVTAAAKCSPAVVTVDTVQTKRRVVNPFGLLSQDFFRDFNSMWPPFGEYEEEVPMMGSGFIFDADGYILTAEHVIHGADKIEVTLADNRTFPAEWVGSDYENDVAVLKIEGSDLPYIKLGDSSDLMIGEWSLAIGNPFGVAGESASPTVSVGVISALGRQVRNSGEGGFRFYEDLVQTDASINPGNSGGPLVNALGEAIGVNATIITTSGGSLGIGFAVPINVARESARGIIKEPTAGQPWIGAYLVEITPAIAASFGLPNDDGLIISDIDENAPAYHARLRRGDIILAVNGREVNDVAAYYDILSGVTAGSGVQLKVWRQGQVLDGKVPTETRPGP